PSTIVLSLLLAVALNAMTGRLREFFTFIYFMPSIISTVAISLVWRWLYHPSFGLINAILDLFGLTKQPFLTSSSQALICLCVVQIWCIFGYYAVVLLAAIRNIDKSLYEASSIDGANSFKQFFKITLPLLRNNILFVCIMSTTTAFMFFTPVKVLTNGTPGTSTQVLLLHIMNRGITNSDIGYASAMSMVLMLIILSFSVLQWVLTKERKARPSYMRPELRARLKKAEEEKK
ncbi:MAG: sugar ABC transporter permease, partial [Christensenella sp.]